MSGKLIMKRKLDKTYQSSLDNKVEKSTDLTLPSSSMTSKSVNTKNIANKSDEPSVSQTEIKRIRCDTPPPEPEDLDLPPLQRATGQNRHFLETIQLKMLELQNELDALEHDVEAHEEDYSYINDIHNNNQNNQINEPEAEALGFAICAQETMLFLQREGISLDSLLYTRLRDALVGRSSLK